MPTVALAAAMLSSPKRVGSQRLTSYACLRLLPQ